MHFNEIQNIICVYVLISSSNHKTLIEKNYSKFNEIKLDNLPRQI